MRSISVKQLKEDLSRYLDEARAGEEVLIKERNKPVVKLVPVNGNGQPATGKAKSAAKKKAGSRKAEYPWEHDRPALTLEQLAAHEAKMVAEGRMRPPKVEPTPEFWDEFFSEPRPNISLDEIRLWINEDRDED